MRGGLLLAGLVAVVAAGCGGGHAQTDAGVDRQTDRPEPTDVINEEPPPPDVGPQEDVILPPPDGPSCSTTGGNPVGWLCGYDEDCACPLGCLRRQTQASGSCWTRCDPTANDPGCGDGETCLAGAGGLGGCVPRGTLAGSFDVPMYQAPATPASYADLGTAAVTLEVGLIGQMVFASGWGTTATDGAADLYRLYLYPGTGEAVDWDKPLVVELAADASYVAGATYDLAATPAKARIRYHEYNRDLQVIVRDLLRAEVPTGSVHLTAAGQGGQDPVTGTVSGAAAVEYESVLCSPDTTPCQ